MQGLSAEQLAGLKNRLQERRSQLQEEIREQLVRSDEAHYADLAERVHDVGEESVADLLADFSIAIIDRQLRDLKEVEEALKRIAMGSYGDCVDCGEEIGHQRLDVYPTARRCVSCQAHHEKTYAQDGTPTL